MDKIKTIKNVDEISDEPQVKDVELKAVKSSWGRKIADAQARIWDINASLILVCIKQTISKPPDFVSVWLYIYKNKDQTAWLGVTVCSRGVIDVGVKPSSPAMLKNWAMLGKWKIDKKGFILIASDKSQPIWVDVDVAGLPGNPYRYYNALTGKEIPRRNLSNIRNRPALWEKMTVNDKVFGRNNQSETLRYSSPWSLGL